MQEVNPDWLWRDEVTIGAEAVLVSKNPGNTARAVPSAINRVLMADSFAGSHEVAGSVMALWLEFGDALDGPARYSRNLEAGQVIELIRQAAREWLELDASPDSVIAYIRRWDDWPCGLL